MDFKNVQQETAKGTLILIQLTFKIVHPTKGRSVLV